MFKLDSSRFSAVWIGIAETSITKLSRMLERTEVNIGGFVIYRAEESVINYLEKGDARFEEDKLLLKPHLVRLTT